MDELDPSLTDEELDRLWDDVADALEPEARRDLERALIARPDLVDARRQIAGTHKSLALLDAPGPTPNIAGSVVARLSAREAPAPQPWLWLALVAQVALGVAALAWAAPGLASMLRGVDWLPTWQAGRVMADLQSLWVGVMSALGEPYRLLEINGLEPATGSLWLSACVAGAVLAWAAGNSVLLAKPSARRSSRR